MSRKKYNAYINSASWSAKKAEFRKSEYYRGECFCCKRKGGDVVLYMHHRTYKRMGKERLTDLVEVCQDCHTCIHAAGKIWTNHHRLRTFIKYHGREKGQKIMLDGLVRKKPKKRKVPKRKVRSTPIKAKTVSTQPWEYTNDRKFKTKRNPLPS